MHGVSLLSLSVRPSLALVVMLSMAAIHAWFVEGYTGLFWGDYGVWLHQVERFARGEVIYRDFYTPSPPLSVWLIGSLAKIVGTDLRPIFAITAFLYLLLVVAYWRYLVLLLSPPLLAPVAITGLVLLNAFAMTHSTPLPLGMYVPAAPVAVLCLLVALLFALPFDGPLSRSRALGLGVFAALCILAKQDVWAPAVLLLVIRAAFALRAGERDCALPLAAAFLLTVLAGAGLIGASAGPAALPKVVTGFGMAEYYGIGRSLPSWERLILQGVALALIAVAVFSALALFRSRTFLFHAASSGLAVLLLLSIYLWQAMSIYDRLRQEGPSALPTETESALTFHASASAASFRPTFGMLRNRLKDHMIPLLLPILLLAGLLAHAARRKDWRPAHLVLITLLAIAVAARMRRGFEYTEWYHYALELPIYALLLERFVPDASRRLVVLGCTALLGIGFYTYWDRGTGLLTREGSHMLQVQTPRGTASWPASQIKDYRAIRQVLDRLDPSGTRPLFAFGHSGGFNYFLRRPNPSPVTFGLSTSVVSPQTAIAMIAAAEPRPFLIYNRAYARASVPQVAVSVLTWEQPRMANHYMVYDLGYFNQLLAVCGFKQQVPWKDMAFFTIFSCDQTNTIVPITEELLSATGSP